MLRGGGIFMYEPYKDRHKSIVHKKTYVEL